MRSEYSKGIKQGAGVFRLKFSEQVLKDILSAGYKEVSIRVSCREDNIIAEYSHNNTDSVALVSGQTEYLLTCKRCKIRSAGFSSGSEYAYPYQYELRLTDSKGTTKSPNGRKNLHDSNGSKYDQNSDVKHYDGYIVITELQINNSRIEESNL